MNDLTAGKPQPSEQTLLTHPDFELGQYIPFVYHFHMLADEARMGAFQKAIAATVRSHHVVLELGGGTGVLSYFSAQSAARVICVERNPELVQAARRFLSVNTNGARVQVVQADAFDYLPPCPVDVVICEMLHVGMLREKQLQMIQSFKARYLAQFGLPLPRFIPEAYFQAVQPVQQSFDFHGYVAPGPCFQDPATPQPRTRELGAPVLYHAGSYEDVIALDCSWTGQLVMAQAGHFNALRIITKSVLAVLVQEQRTIDWTNQYLVVPLVQPTEVAPNELVTVGFRYQAGDPIAALQPRLIRP